jgi:coenzyme F420-0:L-glutamate ligase/coenzyme F420-1:gamma-L-glutamate ligase
MGIQVYGIEGLPLISSGDDLAILICERFSFKKGDILSLASSVYSKAKGHVRDLSTVVPSQKAKEIAAYDREDPRFVQVVLDEASDILLERPFILSQMPSGHIGVRSGVDRSNIRDGMVILLPPDPMKAADEFRENIMDITGITVGVIITDTVGRAFRRGQTGNAIGWSGMPAIRDFRGDSDLFGHRLLITEEAVVDELAGFANFVMGESDQGVPAVVFRGCDAWEGHNNLFFAPDEDVIRGALRICQGEKKK